VGRPGGPPVVTVTRLVLPGVAIAPGEVRVPAAAAHHARVTRVAPGETVELLDLAGQVGVGRLRAWDGPACVVQVETVVRERGEPPAPLVLALGVLHTDAFAWAVEKAAELGATHVVPVVTERVQGRRHEGRRDRWQRLADAAVAQCGRSRPPRVADPCPLAELLAGATGRRLVAHAGAAEPPAEAPAPAGITILVGPEGGLSGEELAAALAAGFAPLRLGPRVLRAETAAVAGLAVAQRLAGWL